MAIADSIATEAWLPIPGYEGIYSVSDQGRVRRDRGIRKYAAGRFLKPAGNGTGYLKVTLCHSSNGNRQWLVHRLVALAFIGSAPTGYQVNHRNGIKTDNRAANIEYATPRENQLHKHAVLGYVHPGPEPRFGERHPHSRLTDNIVREIRSLYAQGRFTQKQIGAMFGLGQTHVGKIVRRVLWPHVA